MSSLSLEDLDRLFFGLRPAFTKQDDLTAHSLVVFLDIVRDLLPAAGAEPQQEAVFRVQKPILSSDLVGFFSKIEVLLDEEQQAGALINPWSLADLRFNEVRTGAVLAGLWSESFGGRASRAFLTHYLSSALPGTCADWRVELELGYRVRKEFCPLGGLAERVDIVIETKRFLVGIEVKINAPLGERQLERYQEELGRHARVCGKSAHVVLLSRKSFSPVPGVPCLTWKDLAASARASCGSRAQDRGFAAQLIARFGDHVYNL
ncbi:PD-(D/E)XK nuclease family protein [Paracoccus marcusii]|uniref:PD-(D/E)XK nuclease family protein n=1 Tax=Paracoccus marcusii TaxID=59779 RepID=UPI00373702B9